MKLYLGTAFVALLLALTIPLEAHHSNVTFYFMDETVEMRGTVVELVVVNPHGRLEIEINDESGEKVIWTVDTPNATGMRARGWTDTTLTPGETITVTGHPARNPAANGMYGQTVTRADGTVLPFGGGRPNN